MRAGISLRKGAYIRLLSVLLIVAIVLPYIPLVHHPHLLTPSEISARTTHELPGTVKSTGGLNHEMFPGELILLFPFFIVFVILARMRLQHIQAQIPLLLKKKMLASLKFTSVFV